MLTQSQDKRQKIGTIALYGIFAVFYFYLAAQIPYTYDDWDWGLPIGLHRLITAEVNSRFAGNFFEVLMTRSELLKTLFIGACYFLIPYLITRITEMLMDTQPVKRPILFVCASFLMLTMSKPMWKQTYSWIAGFANFGICAVFMLLCMFPFIRLFKDTPVGKISIGRSILYVILTFLGQLFLENVAFFMVAVTACTNILHYIKYKKINGTYIAMLIAAVAGMVILFSNAIFSSLFSTGEAISGVRTLSFQLSDGIGKILYNIFYQCMRLAQRGGQGSFIAIWILLLLNLAAKHSGSKYKSAFLVLNSLFLLYFAIAPRLPYNGTLWILLGGGMSLTFYSSVVVEVLLLFKGQTGLQTKLLTLLACALTTILPLTITSENSPRVFFTFHVFLVLFSLVLLSALPRPEAEKKKKRFFIGILSLTAAIMLTFTWCYTQIGLCRTERQQLIEQAVAQNQSSVTLPRFPYDDLLWSPDGGEDGIESFKMFFGIPSDMEVIFK